MSFDPSPEAQKHNNEIMKLEYDTWYWVGDPREGDIWYPVFVNSNFEAMMDGKAHDLESIKGLTVIKAVMPLAD